MVLCGNMATDDPEGTQIYEKIMRQARNLIEKGDMVVVTDPMSSNFIFINALQRISSVIIQKSTREGFGLTVTEALWKGTPVVASNVGGIPLQIEDGQSGFLVEPEDTQGFADRIVDLLRNPKLAKKMGKTGKEGVRKNFLITRLLSDHLDFLRDVLENR